MRYRKLLSHMLLSLGAVFALSAHAADKPNILVIWGDDIGITNISAYSDGIMGYHTPKIDRIANEGVKFMRLLRRTKLHRGRARLHHRPVIPCAPACSPSAYPAPRSRHTRKTSTMAELLKPLGYATGQFGKNHLGDKDEYLPHNHGFDEFFGNLYHLNAEEEPEDLDYPKDAAFRQMFGPRGVLDCYADGGMRGHRPDDAQAHGNG
jgi:arylsulfatase A-like enzyme